MQKAIYYVSKPIAARGMLELTDRRLLFQVFPFDASFGIKNLSIELTSVKNVEIQTGDLHPRVIIHSSDKKYEFMLSKGRELYDRLSGLLKNPLSQKEDSSVCEMESENLCSCGRSVNGQFIYCPWCGNKLLST